MNRGPVKQVLQDPGAPFTGDPYAPTEPMPEYVQHMAKETQEILVRLRTMAAFMRTQTFHDLPALERELMTRQREKLICYAESLSLQYCMALLTHG